LTQIRVARPDERARVLETIVWAFGGDASQHEPDRFFALLDPERVLVAADGDGVVGGSGAFTFRMSVPGGADAGCAGITVVSVLPSHRRRGLLTRMMRRLLDDAHARGEPLAALFASEGAIYGRYGFAWAIDDRHLEADATRIAFRDPPDAGVRVRLLSPDEALERLPPLYEAERARRPGMLLRDERWWREHRLFDPEFRRRGGGPLFHALLELDGEPSGYALYRLRRTEQPKLLGLALQVLELLAPSPRAARELWRFLFSIDLVRRVDAFCLPADDPLPLLVGEPAALGLGVRDGLWLRLVDVGAALAARELGPGAVVVELADGFCPWNEGRWRIAADVVARTEEQADLALGADALAAAYLGGWTLARLASAGRVEELAPGSLARADALLRTERAPWCPENF